MLGVGEGGGWGTGVRSVQGAVGTREIIDKDEIPCYDVR